MSIEKINLNHIKLQAKKLKKELNITHAQSLDLVAKDKGYSNWMHCHRVLSQKNVSELNERSFVEKQSKLCFTDWLKRQKNRDSPLGDLAKDVINDTEWPLYENIQDYTGYLHSRNASVGAVSALERAFRSYKAYFKRTPSSQKNKPTPKSPASNKSNQRKIVYVSNVTPLRFDKRTIENFNCGDLAWISWDGRKAVPVTILDVKDENYLLKIERPIKKAGNKHWLFLDEVRSTPELACANHVTL